MEFLEVVFPVSGVKSNLLVPPLVALSISFFSSMGGLSGAFFIVPFQVSVLGYVSPSVSATNFVYNIVGIPGGLLSYMREGRMNWPLAAVIVAGSVPGILAGYFLRISVLPDPERFKVFVGLVLLAVGGRLFYDVLHTWNAEKTPPAGAPGKLLLKGVKTGLFHLEFRLGEERYTLRTMPLFFFTLGVGIVGGAYGIGGGAVVAPFLVAVFRLPVYAVAGATLLGTFVASIAGVTFYSAIPSAHQTSPDWLLGLLFGAGGVVGMYLGGRAQRHVPQRIIKLILGVILLFVAGNYLVGGIR
jgi:uncharacterized membrane protein YfcA